VIRSGLIQAPLKKLEHYKHFNSTKTKRVILLLLPRDWVRIYQTSVLKPQILFLNEDFILNSTSYTNFHEKTVGDNQTLALINIPIKLRYEKLNLPQKINNEKLNKNGLGRCWFVFTTCAYIAVCVVANYCVDTRHCNKRWNGSDCNASEFGGLSCKLHNTFRQK
jgi:hypothetical protein